MNTNRTGIIRRIAATAAVAGTLTAGPLVGSASAYDTYRSGSSVGVHSDAPVVCTNSPYRTLTAWPSMGTTPGWEWGQTVAWRYYVYNVTTGRYVVQETAWRYAKIVTAHVTPAIYGPYVTVDASAALPGATWTLAPGRYKVWIDYAWNTGSSWSYAQSVTTAYSNNYYSLGFKKLYSAGACDIDMVRNS
jgi:hypothetical protein